MRRGGRGASADFVRMRAAARLAETVPSARGRVIGPRAMRSPPAASIWSAVDMLANSLNAASVAGSPSRKSR